MGNPNLAKEGEPYHFGPDWPGRRCGAMCKRTGLPCKAPAMRGKARCRMHGGKSTGPTTPEGKARQRAAVTVHGIYAKEGNPIRPEGGYLAPDFREELRRARKAMRYFDTQRD